MKTFFASPRVAIATIAIVAVAVLSPMPERSASAQTAAVYVNGRLIHFDQPPIERGSRIFVPLRGVFENLGASVVYNTVRQRYRTGVGGVHRQCGGYQ